MSSTIPLDLVLRAQNKTKDVFNEVNGSVDDTKDKIKSLKEQMQDVGSSMKNVGSGLTAGVTLPIVGLGLAALKGAADQEQLQVAFSTMLGSADKAKTMLSELADFASSTPFEMPEVQGAAKSLIAYGIASKDVKDTLRTLGDVASGVGVPLGDIATLYGKASVQGRLFSSDINQLTGRGIPILKYLGEVLGVSQDKVAGLVEAGKVGFPELQKAFSNMTAEGGQFNGMMDAQSKTVLGMMSTLSDQVTLTLQAVGQSMFDAFDVQKNVGGFLEWLTQARTQLTEFIKNNPELFKMILIFAGIAAAIGPILVGLGMIVGAVAPLAPLFSLMLGPIGLIVAAVTLLGIGFATNFGGMRDLIMGVISYFDPLIEKIKSVASAFMSFGGDAFLEVIAQLTGFGIEAHDTTEGIQKLVAALTGSQEMGTAFADTISNIGGALYEAQTAMSEFVSGTDVQTALQGIKEKFGEIGQAVKGLFSGETGVSEFASKISEAISGIPALVSSMFTGADFSAAKEKVLVALGLENLSFDAAVQSLKDQFAKINWSELVFSFANLVTTIGEWWAKIEWGILSWSFENLIKPIYDAFIKIDWTALGVSFLSLVTYIGEEIGKVNWADMALSFVNLVSSVSEKIGLTDWASATFNFDNLKNAVSTKIAETDWTGNAEQFKIAMAGFKDGAITGLTASIEGTDWKQSSIDFSKMVTGISEKIDGVDWAALGTKIAGGISSFLSGDWIGDATTTFAGLTTSISKGLEGVEYTTPSTAFDKLKTAVAKAWTDISWTDITTSFDALKTSITSGLGEFATGFTAGFKTPAWLTSITSWKFPDLSESVKGLISWKFPDLSATAKSLITWTFPELTALGQKLLNWTWPGMPAWLEKLFDWQPKAPGWVTSLLGYLGVDSATKAVGGTLGAGTTIVNERGGESMIVPIGTEIMNHRETTQMALNDSARTPTNVTVIINGVDYSSMSALASAVIDEINRRS